MTVKERMLALVQGRPQDQAPFVQYSSVAGFPSDNEVRALVGPENVGFTRWVTAHRFETPHCRCETEAFHRGELEGVRTTINTPVGVLYEERLLDPVMQTSAASSHFVKTVDDYRILLAYLKDITVVKDLRAVRTTVEALGDFGLPHLFTTRTPFQQLWIQWVSAENLIPHMLEHAELLDEVFACLFDIQKRIFEVVCEAVQEAPIPYVVVGDNITAPMIGIHYFETYCTPSYDLLADMLDDTGLDIPVFVHMDGDLKPLWPSIDGCRVRGLDSMSPPPDNDTRVADAIARWPEMRLLINFPSSAHLWTPDAIHEKALELLEESGRAGHLQIQISENVPPTIWRTSYPAIVRAIREFGPVGA